MDDGRWRTAGAAFADAFDAEVVGGLRYFVEGNIHRRHLAGPRDAVVEIGTSEQLARVVVAHRLEQRLAKTLGDAAMHLAGRQKRIDEASAIIHRGVLHHFHGAGVAVDLHFGDVAAVWKRIAAAAVVAHRFGQCLAGHRRCQAGGVE